MKSDSVSTSAYLISDSHRSHSAPKLTKQISLSPGPSIKQQNNKKSFKYLKPPLPFPLLHRDRINQSDLALYNPKHKHLAIPNPNYFVKQRKESSSSNHTDNEDSNNEDSRYHSLQMDGMERKGLHLRLRDKKYFSRDVYSSEDSKDNNENLLGEVEKPKKLKKVKARPKAASLWCLQKTDEDYKALKSRSSEFDDVFVKKSRRKSRSRRGSRVLLHESSEENFDVYHKESTSILTKLKNEKYPFWRSNTEIVSRKYEKPPFWRHNSTETAIVSVNSGKSLSKKLLMNLKLSLFGHIERSERVDLMGHNKPLVFGGTFPIDMPLGGDTRNRIVIEKDVTDKVMPMAEVKTFEIDAPISRDDVTGKWFDRRRWEKDGMAKTFNIDEPYY